MVSPPITVVASSSEFNPVYVRLVPAFCFSDERSALGTAPAPETPSKVHAMEVATLPMADESSSRWK
jgi:hypothetical protein